MKDCLLIGFNSSEFPAYVEMVRGMGEDCGAYRDLNLAFIEYKGKPYTSMEMLNQFYFEGKEDSGRMFHNCDFLWPTITYLGTYLSRRGYTFDYVNLFQQEKDKLREKLERNDILTIGITTTLYVSPHPIIEMISFIRKYNQTAKIVVGGPFISNQVKLLDLTELQKFLKYLGADFYVINQEGEKALTELLDALKNGGDLSAIDNLGYCKGEDYVINELSLEGNSLAENMVNYQLFPTADLGEFVSLRTAKSCPFSCAFCGFPQRAGKYTYLDLDLVERELDGLQEAGSVTTLTFLDDTFNVPKKRFKDILRLMIRKQYGFKWNSFYRSDHGDEEAIELMGKAGCEGVFLGIESGSDAMLQVMNKTSRRKDYLKAIPLLQQAGISVHCNFIVGFPSETIETYQETISLIEEAKPDFYRAQLWYCDPVTPIWKRREEFGVKGSSFNWSHDTMDYPTACDWVDRLFLGIENSTWLPQYGFEQWSTFYLQRQGMSMPQIKRYLRAFNSLVKKKLLNPGQRETDPTLIEELRRSAQFDRPQEPVDDVIEFHRGSAYMAAESFWLEHFRDSSATSSLQMIRQSGDAPNGDWEEVSVEVDRQLISRLYDRFEAGLEDALLAAYSVLLGRISGQEESVILTAREIAGRREVLPLRLFPYWEARFDQFLVTCQTGLRQAVQHHAFGLHIVTNRWRMAFGDAEVPILETGFLLRNTGERHEGSELVKSLADRPLIADSLALNLEIVADGDAFAVFFCYPAGHFSRQTIEELAGNYLSILEKISEDPQVALGAMSLDRTAREVDAMVDVDAGETFNF